MEFDGLFFAYTHCCAGYGFFGAAGGVEKFGLFMIAYVILEFGYLVSQKPVHDALQLQHNQLQANQDKQAFSLAPIAPPTLKQSIKTTIKALGRSIQFRWPALAGVLKPIYSAVLRLYRAR